MSDKPIRLTATPEGYINWLAELKARIHVAQQRAVLAVNRELVLLYWQMGRDILARQDVQGWGSKVIERLSKDLRTEFPEMKGFSPRNLMYMRAFAEAWPDGQFVQDALAQLPWRHQLALINNPGFNPIEFDGIRMQTSLPSIDQIERGLTDADRPIEEEPK